MSETTCAVVRAVFSAVEVARLESAEDSGHYNR